MSKTDKEVYWSILEEKTRELASEEEAMRGLSASRKEIRERIRTIKADINALLDDLKGGGNRLPLNQEEGS